MCDVEQQQQQQLASSHGSLHTQAKRMRWRVPYRSCLAGVAAISNITSVHSVLKFRVEGLDMELLHEVLQSLTETMVSACLVIVASGMHLLHAVAAVRVRCAAASSSDQVLGCCGQPSSSQGRVRTGESTHVQSMAVVSYEGSDQEAVEFLRDSRQLV
jgi:hypothetical protein